MTEMFLWEYFLLNILSYDLLPLLSITRGSYHVYYLMPYIYYTLINNQSLITEILFAMQAVLPYVIYYRPAAWHTVKHA